MEESSQKSKRCPFATNNNTRSATGVGLCALEKVNGYVDTRSMHQNGFPDADAVGAGGGSSSSSRSSSPTDDDFVENVEIDKDTLLHVHENLKAHGLELGVRKCPYKRKLSESCSLEDSSASKEAHLDLLLEDDVVEERPQTSPLHSTGINVLSRPGVVNVGSRKSQLALIQTNTIISHLKTLHPDLVFDIETMDTLGDKILHLALPKIGEKSLFTKDLEIALAEGRVDFLVHSLKDLPTTIPHDMCLGAIYKRDSPLDAVLFHPKHQGLTLDDLPKNSVIGTSSLRRVAQLKRRFPHLKFESVRGNLNTRYRKLEEEGKFDALILAAAGVDRMAWTEKVGQVLTPDECLYAVGQGAMAVEVRRGDAKTISLVAPLSDLSTLMCCGAERAFMRNLDGGCSVPIGTCSEIENGKLRLRGAVFSLDGSVCLDETVSVMMDLNRSAAVHSDEKSGRKYAVTESGMVVEECYLEELLKAEKLGFELAGMLREQGADCVLRIARGNMPKVNIHVPSKES